MAMNNEERKLFNMISEIALAMQKTLLESGLTDLKEKYAKNLRQIRAGARAQDGDILLHDWNLFDLDEDLDENNDDDDEPQ
jgi:hypothetical protein